MNAGIVEPIYAVNARQRHGKHVSAATDIGATIEDAVFSMRSVPRLYNEDQLDKPKSGAVTKDVQCP
jgi:hypothetical protein